MQQRQITHHPAQASVPSTGQHTFPKEFGPALVGVNLQDTIARQRAGVDASERRKASHTDRPAVKFALRITTCWLTKLSPTWPSSTQGSQWKITVPQERSRSLLHFSLSFSKHRAYFPRFRMRILASSGIASWSSSESSCNRHSSTPSHQTGVKLGSVD